MNTHRISPPRKDKPPLKANVFETMRQANCQLLPLFPYLDEGAMVPAGAIFHSRFGTEVGHFFHTNSVDEVVVVFGSQSSYVQPGQVYASARTHGVGRAPKDPSDPQAFSLSVITQRQSTGEEQKEAFVIRCHACNEVILEHEYDATPAPLRGEGDQYFPALTTLMESAEAIESFNTDQRYRSCVKCGAEQPLFPEDRFWSWSRFVAQNHAAHQARQALLGAAEQLKRS